MRCLLAMFDQAYRSPDDGSYWTWRHQELPLSALDALYYDCASAHWPRGAEPRPRPTLRGGCASVGEDWICWYRLVDGGCDPQGRPGRYVLLAAFVPRSDHQQWDWSWLLECPQFVQLALAARTACPILAPDELEIQCEPTPLTSATADDELCRTGHTVLTAVSGFAAVAATCATIPGGQEFDCFLVRQQEVVDVRLSFRDSSSPHDWPRRDAEAVQAQWRESRPEPLSLWARLLAAVAKCVAWAQSRSGRSAFPLAARYFTKLAPGSLFSWLGRHRRRFRAGRQCADCDPNEPPVPVCETEVSQPVEQLRND